MDTILRIRIPGIGKEGSLGRKVLDQEKGSGGQGFKILKGTELIRRTRTEDPHPPGH